MGNPLRITKSQGPGLMGGSSRASLSWLDSPAARNFLVLQDDQKSLGSPARLMCGVAQEFVDTGEANPNADGLLLYSVSGMDEDCAP